MLNDPYLAGLEARSIYIIREAYWRYRDKLAVLWSMGKDSTAMLHLVRKSFLGSVSIPVLHIDTTYKFPEIYRFRDRFVKKWRLDLIIAKNDEAIKSGMSPAKGRLDCCHALKTEALKQAIARHGFKALLLAIRRDEHSIRAKERYFSPRDADFRWNYHEQPLEMGEQSFQGRGEGQDHLRIHPMLHWREIDIWRYIKAEKIPINPLYFAKGGKRYRSIGCACCCEPVESSANTIEKVIKELESTKIAERAGRTQDKEREYMMQKLRSLGYM
ncbi:MAG TPA: sulfate adenylyltransferase [Candidatus Omnitrophica bacterium]|nr:sulfate adenylyltransferase [Candidatus Omnitrophota bacterium]